MKTSYPRFLIALLLGLGIALSVRAADLMASGHWTATWFTSQQLTEPSNLPPAPGLNHATLRQFVSPTLSGQKLRVTLSNIFGQSPLVVTAAHVAIAGATEDAIDPATDHALQFHGQSKVVLEPGASMISDPLDQPVAALQRLAVTLQIDLAPPALTGHPGSRTTSYFCPGDFVAAERLAQPVKVDHWYFLTSIDVWTKPTSASIVALGDSITDGRGSTTNQNNRWPDDLARRLQGKSATKTIAVLNAGIGGNRLLRDGLGPNVLSRFDRDVLAPAGVRWVILFEGINDIGTGKTARVRHEPYATADDIIGAYEQVVTRAHAHGIRVIGATITPYEGADFYFTPEGEADREKINSWIRGAGHFDAVIDFDAVVRDPAKPTHLAAKFDSGDHLHPSPAGYEAMAGAIDLRLFTAGKR